MQSVPVVMAFSGHDPSGGAGIQADIEALASMGCHCAPIITALTVQDTHRASRFVPVDPALILEQARTVLADLPVAAFKLGMLGSPAAVRAVATILEEHPAIPVVLDPVAAAGGGGSLGSAPVTEALAALLPFTTILTPNSLEARALAPAADDLDGCAAYLLERGCQYVLVTGAHEETAEVENRLYAQGRRAEVFTWERLPHSYHGSGCTLAAAIAGLLALGLEPFTAVHEAQEYTWDALHHAYRIGQGQHLPNRLFWARQDAPARPD